ncbi:MMPL family transporter [Demequina silvatica]|uniref:MMPL family transporter n=1 Tax=Demequina silvatica TaxID=1638988 RepID=UPI000A8BC90C|nr:MMPL family transporter [Demequina silvatica]
MLFALGRWAFRARRLVLAGWIVALVAVLGASAAVGTGTTNSYTFPGTESQDALDSLARTFPQFSGTSAQLVAVAPPGGDVRHAAFRDAVEDAVTRIQGVDQVAGASSPYSGAATGNVAPDGSAALVPIQLTVQAPEVLPSTSERLQREGARLQRELPAGSQVAVGGALYSQTDASIGISEVTSLGIAYAVLAVTFLSLVAAGMPLATATLGVGIAVALVFAVTRWVTITSTAPLLAVMLGLAVGVDYALFVISRHQDQLRRGMTPEESAPRAIATAGSAVVFAATTVIIALVGLAVAGIPFLTVTGAAAALGVASAALIGLTLTPALLGFAGWRVLRRRDRPGAGGQGDDAAAGSAPATGPPGEGGEEPPPEAAGEPVEEPPDPPPEPEEPPPEAPVAGVFGRWVRAATRWPAVTVVLLVALLAAAAIPATGIRLALPDSGSLPEGSPGRVTYDLIAEHFGPGFNGPLLLTGSVIQSTDPVTLVDRLGDDVAAVPGVAEVVLATPNQTGDTAIIQAVPSGAPDSEQTERLVHRLRALEPRWLDEYAVELSVTGYTAVGIDISDQLGAALAPFALLVVGVSLVLLAMVFRSIVVPITAALGYLLSIGVAFGAATLVFVDGHLAEPVSVAHVGSIISFMPIIVMGVLFGLAMDYEVFLVSRMREHYLERPDPRRAIHTGFVGSARVVTAAAIIMTAVFGGFVRGGEASIQPIALGLAVGVACDAFLVRMTLIPAVLALFGHAAWWFPRTLDRLLPRVDIEGADLAVEDSLAPWPPGGSAPAIAVERMRVRDAPELEVTVAVPGGHVLVVEGGSAEDRTAVLLALTGRAAVTDGLAKVDGLVLPVRAASVRRRSAYVRLGARGDPVARLLDALAHARVRVIAVDGADAVPAGPRREELAGVLRSARGGTDGNASVPVTLVVSCPAHEAIADLVEGLPDVRLASGEAATPATAGATA